ncbi:MAG: tRNA (adenosine(37)-N6)-dimethylallyltransferase MiaA [Lentisphaeria bacterium]|nr:tRNA (adenosine(37)-N6)-dimethylallyltransferase MiaA [Lentisphaeria bacterium]
MTPATLRNLLDAIRRTSGIPVIMGPTAAGKSELAFALARECGGEIVSADSMQFYRGLDIGTAKPTAEERRLVPHHLIDSMDISEKSDVFRFRTDALRIIGEIRSRGHLPVVAGGSGLYLHALVYGLDVLPAKQSLRDELDAAYDNEEHFPELAAIMERECPFDFRRFHPHRRKLIRAREVFLLSGKQISELQSGGFTPDPAFAQFVLVRERTDLVNRIRRRAARMLESGWIEEAKEMLAKGLLRTPTAWQAIGYAQIGDYLAGKMTREELLESIVIATRQYARRQASWFRSQHKEAAFLTVSAED